MADSKGGSMPLDITPALKARAKAVSGFFSGCVGSTKALDFASDGGFFLFSRAYKRETSNGVFEDRSTLVQVEAPMKAADSDKSDEIVDALKQNEVVLPTKLYDLAKVDSQHVVASMGLDLNIWKRSEDEGFYGMVGSVRTWVEETPMHLVMPRPEDSACLIAAHGGIRCIQLDGQRTELRSFQESGTVASIQWHDRYTFSLVQEQGTCMVYDMRVENAVAFHYLQDGLFDHKIIGSVGGQGHLLACGGVGGVIHILDTRNISQPVQAISDPHLQSIAEFASTLEGDLMAFGQDGFTLWNTRGSEGLNFRELHESKGALCGTFVGLTRAVTTDPRGNLCDWDVKIFVDSHPASHMAAISRSNDADQPQTDMTARCPAPHVPTSAPSSFLALSSSSLSSLSSLSFLSTISSTSGSVAPNGVAPGSLKTKKRKYGSGYQRARVGGVFAIQGRHRLSSEVKLLRSTIEGAFDWSSFQEEHKPDHKPGKFYYNTGAITFDSQEEKKKWSKKAIADFDYQKAEATKAAAPSPPLAATAQGAEENVCVSSSSILTLAPVNGGGGGGDVGSLALLASLASSFPGFSSPSQSLPVSQSPALESAVSATPHPPTDIENGGGGGGVGGLACLASLASSFFSLPGFSSSPSSSLPESQLACPPTALESAASAIPDPPDAIENGGGGGGGGLDLSASLASSPFLSLSGYSSPSSSLLPQLACLPAALGSAAAATPDPPRAVGNLKSLATLLLEMETTIGLGVSDNRSTSFSEWHIPRRIGDIEEACGIHAPAPGTNAGEEYFALSLLNRIHHAAGILGVDKNM